MEWNGEGTIVIRTNEEIMILKKQERMIKTKTGTLPALVTIHLYFYPFICPHISLWKCTGPKTTWPMGHDVVIPIEER